MFPLKDNHHLKNKLQSSNYSEWVSLMVMYEDPSGYAANVTESVGEEK